MKSRFALLIWVIVIISACTDKKETYTIFTIGDSTMADKKPEVYPETGWCQVLSDYFEESVVVKNHAVNGRSSKSFIDEGRWDAVLDSLKKGDFVFIQFGHNDQKKYDTTRYTSPFGNFAENLKKFVSETREMGATPILITSIVRRKFGEYGKLKDTHGNYPVAIRKVADELVVDFVDLQKITENWINNLGDEASKEMYLWTEPSDNFPEGKKDDTHLSVKGANQVAKFMLLESIKLRLKYSGEIKRTVKN